MSNSNKEIIIIGAGETADIAFEYFSYDSDRKITAFAVESEFLTENVRNGLPVISLENLQELYPPDNYEVFVAISYSKLNRVRERLFKKVKELNYICATYISSKAFVWRTAQIGENCMIFEGNVIQHGVTIEDNVYLWSSNHIGHQVIIGHSAYISSHVVISGFCKVGARSFLGVNATLVDGIIIGEDCMIAAGAVVRSNTKPLGIYQGNPAILREGVSSLQYFRVKKG